MNKPKIQWTRQQEQQFQALAAARAEALKEMEKPVVAIVDKMRRHHYDHMVSFLKEHADEIRDALEPFDSGVRLKVEDKAGT